MPNIKLKFSASDGVVSRVVRWFTWSKWSHVEAIISDGTIISADSTKNSVVNIENKPVKYSRVVYISVTKDQRNKFEAFLRQQLGYKYDFYGIISFIIRRDIEARKRWFCSELIVAALAAAGIIKPLYIPGRWTPDDVWKALAICEKCEVIE